VLLAPNLYKQVAVLVAELFFYFFIFKIKQMEIYFIINRQILSSTFLVSPAEQITLDHNTVCLSAALLNLIWETVLH
jgi:hypothetical protein